MPINADPNARVSFSLAGDKDKPAHQRPVFRGRICTARQAIQLDALFARMDRTDDRETPQSAAERVDIMLEMLRVVIVDWEQLTDACGRAVVYDGGAGIDRLPDILTVAELWQVFYGLREASAVKELDLGKSVSDSNSDTANDAPPASQADAATAGAKTSPPPPAQPSTSAPSAKTATTNAPPAGAEVKSH